MYYWRMYWDIMWEDIFKISHEQFETRKNIWVKSKTQLIIPSVKQSLKQANQRVRVSID